MLNHPDKRIIQDLASLEGNTDFEVVKDWLYKSLLTLHTEGAFAKDEHQVRWNQGACQVLQELLDKSNTAREVIRKF
jgi:hypothetical protein